MGEGDGCDPSTQPVSRDQEESEERAVGLESLARSKAAVRARLAGRSNSGALVARAAEENDCVFRASAAERDVQGLALGSRDHVVAVAMRDQERGRVPRCPGQQAEVSGAIGGLDDGVDAEQAGFEREREQTRFNRGARA